METGSEEVLALSSLLSPWGAHKEGCCTPAQQVWSCHSLLADSQDYFHTLAMSNVRAKIRSSSSRCVWLSGPVLESHQLATLQDWIQRVQAEYSLGRILQHFFQQSALRTPTRMWVSQTKTAGELQGSPAASKLAGNK